MSAIVLSFRTGASPRIIDEVSTYKSSCCYVYAGFAQLYGSQPVFIPKMPALGLLLEYPVFDSYNKKVADISANLQSDDAGYRPPIDFELYRVDMEKFKDKFIYENMRTTEERSGMYVFPWMTLQPRSEPILDSMHGSVVWTHMEGMICCISMLRVLCPKRQS